MDDRPGLEDTLLTVDEDAGTPLDAEVELVRVGVCVGGLLLPRPEAVHVEEEAPGGEDAMLAQLFR